MTILLCDVGGTHIRFALNSDEPLFPHKTRVDQYPDLKEAIASFLQSRSVSPENIKAFYLAFSNRNEWNTDPGELRSFLPQATIRQVNDFEANAYGVIKSNESDFLLLKQSEKKTIQGASKAVIGVGTGLGFSYICGRKGNEFVQRTHGAHMLPAYSPIHHEIYEFVSRGKKDILIYEDMLTGQGLYNIYAYLSEKNHLDLEYPDAAILMLAGKDNPVFREALTIFFELLGLFAHQAIAFGYAYGGIYLTGGVIDRLIVAGLFNLEAFMHYFVQANVAIVVEDVKSVPIYWIKDEFVSLRGLQWLAGRDGLDA